MRPDRTPGSKAHRRRADKFKAIDHGLRDIRLVDRCSHCGKDQYTSKQRAKQVLRTTFFRGEKMSVYRCPVSTNHLDIWHIGHMAAPIADGRAFRSDIYGGRQRPREQERRALTEVDAEILDLSTRPPSSTGAVRMRRLLSRRADLAECLRDANYDVPALEVNGVKL